MVPWRRTVAGAAPQHRFYHLFREGELEALVEEVPTLRIMESFFDHQNWGVIAERVSSAVGGGMLRQPQLAALEDARAHLNQYWYSETTIRTMVAAIESLPVQRVAFLSTPTLALALTSVALRAESMLFEYDERFRGCCGSFALYDFRHADAFDPALCGQFDLVVIDPPYITRDVWAMFLRTAGLLLAPGGHLLLTTVPRNGLVLQELMDASPLFAGRGLRLRQCAFRPLLVGCVLRFAVFSTCDAPALAVANAVDTFDGDDLDPIFATMRAAALAVAFDEDL